MRLFYKNNKEDKNFPSLYTSLKNYNATTNFEYSFLIVKLDEKILEETIQTYNNQLRKIIEITIKLVNL